MRENKVKKTVPLPNVLNALSCFPCLIKIAKAAIRIPLRITLIVLLVNDIAIPTLIYPSFSSNQILQNHRNKVIVNLVC